MNREILSVYSKGTFCDPSKDSYEPNYVMIIKKDFESFGVCFFDIGI